MEQKFNKGDKVICINNEILKGNENGPNLKLEEEYEIKDIILDSKANQHLDVGLVSSLSWVSSYETGERLPEGDKIHWCHPSRFKLKN